MAANKASFLPPVAPSSGSKPTGNAPPIIHRAVPGSIKTDSPSSFLPLISPLTKLKSDDTTGTKSPSAVPAWANARSSLRPVNRESEDDSSKKTTEATKLSPDQPVIANTVKVSSPSQKASESPLKAVLGKSMDQPPPISLVNDPDDPKTLAVKAESSSPAKEDKLDEVNKEAIKTEVNTTPSEAPKLMAEPGKVEEVFKPKYSLPVRSNVVKQVVETSKGEEIFKPKYSLPVKGNKPFGEPSKNATTSVSEPTKTEEEFKPKYALPVRKALVETPKDDAKSKVTETPLKKDVEPKNDAAADELVKDHEETKETLSAENKVESPENITKLNPPLVVGSEATTTSNMEKRDETTGTESTTVKKALWPPKPAPSLPKPLGISPRHSEPGIMVSQEEKKASPPRHDTAAVNDKPSPKAKVSPLKDSLTSVKTSPSASSGLPGSPKAISSELPKASPNESSNVSQSEQATSAEARPSSPRTLSSASPVSPKMGEAGSMSPQLKLLSSESPVSKASPKLGEAGSMSPHSKPLSSESPVSKASPSEEASTPVKKTSPYTASPFFRLPTPMTDTRPAFSTPLAPFSATSKPPPPSAPQTGFFEPNKPISSSRPPPLPRARPSSASLPVPADDHDLEEPRYVSLSVSDSFSLGKSAVSTETGDVKKDDKTTQNQGTKRPLSIAERKVEFADAATKEPPKKSPPMPAPKDRYRGTSVDEDFDDYEGEEVFYEEDTAPIQASLSGRTTPPPAPPSVSGRSTPPPLPPVEETVVVVEEVLHAEDESDSEESEDSDSEDETARKIKTYQHTSTQMRNVKTDVAALLPTARLRTTTFPLTDNMVEFDNEVPLTKTIMEEEEEQDKVKVEPVVPQPVRPPLPHRPSKVLSTPTPLPPDPSIVSPRSGSGKSSPSSPRKAATGEGEPVNRLQRATSSSMNPDHQKFLVGRLGYSPDRLIQVGPPSSSEPPPSSKNAHYLERWRTLFSPKRRSSSNASSGENRMTSGATSSTNLVSRRALSTVAVLLDAVKWKFYSLPSIPVSKPEEDEAKAKKSRMFMRRLLLQGGYRDPSLATMQTTHKKNKKQRKIKTRSIQWRGSTVFSPTQIMEATPTSELVVLKKRSRGFLPSITTSEGSSRSTSLRSSLIFAPKRRPHDQQDRSLSPTNKKRPLTPPPAEESREEKENEIVKPIAVMNSTIRWSQVNHSDVWL